MILHQETDKGDSTMDTTTTTTATATETDNDVVELEDNDNENSEAAKKERAEEDAENDLVSRLVFM